MKWPPIISPDCSPSSRRSRSSITEAAFSSAPAGRAACSRSASAPSRSCRRSTPRRTMSSDGGYRSPRSTARQPLPSPATATSLTTSPVNWTSADLQPVPQRQGAVSHALHGRRQRRPLQRVRGLSLGAATIPLYSTVTGERLDGYAAGAAYWWQNTRATVLFEPAVRRMLDDGYTHFVELGPHPVLAASIFEIAGPTRPTPSSWRPSGAMTTTAVR